VKKKAKVSTGRSRGRTAPRTGRGRPSARPAKVAPASKGSARIKVRPLRDRVLVRRVEEQQQTVGGIIVPDSAKEKPQQAQVVATGSGRVLENGATAALTVKPGDRVLVGKWSGTEVRIDGQEYLILKEDEILGIFR
jgi:chaperonin GroES